MVNVVYHYHKARTLPPVQKPGVCSHPILLKAHFSRRVISGVIDVTISSPPGPIIVLFVESKSLPSFFFTKYCSDAYWEWIITLVSTFCRYTRISVYLDQSMCRISQSQAFLPFHRFPINSAINYSTMWNELRIRSRVYCKFLNLKLFGCQQNFSTTGLYIFLAESSIEITQDPDIFEQQAENFRKKALLQQIHVFPPNITPLLLVQLDSARQEPLQVRFCISVRCFGECVVTISIAQFIILNAKSNRQKL